MRLDKSEGSVKGIIVLGSAEAPLALPERLRTKTLEISRGIIFRRNIVPPTWVHGPPGPHSFSSDQAGRQARFLFVVDDQDISRLPAWVNTARQTTDGHLLQLAASNGAVLATLDSKIPGSYLVPEKSLP